MTTMIFILFAYLIGSFSSAIIVCKLMRLPDPRTGGSGNPGTTNVLRLGGKVPAILTLLGDVLKGVIPVFVAKWYGLSTLALSAVTLAAFLGHIFPIFFQFQGGKGVATAFGCLIALNLPVGLLLAATWLSVAIITKYSSLSALIAALTAPIYMWVFTQEWNYIAMSIIVSLILIYRHKSNIRKLMRGEESKIGKNRPSIENFNSLITQARSQAKKAGLKKSDIKKIIKK